ncbi:MAG: RNA-binding protein [Verrucomicrobia bacterium]|nr:RNA-binding protein [Verrucomicrobiota bacterium]
MSSSPSSSEGSSAPRSRNRRRRRRGGGGGQGHPQGSHQSTSSHQNPQGSPRQPRHPDTEGVAEGRTRRRYSKPAPKPETLVEKVIRFLTFGIVDSRQNPSTRVLERVPVNPSENRSTGSREGGRKRDRDRDRDRNRDRERERSAERPREAARSRGGLEEGPAESRKEERRERKPPEPVEPTTERLHVGNLDYDVTEADLYDLFNGVGAVRDAEIVYHKYTQRSKGFAFVVMATVEEAKRAFEVLNGKDFMGRPMWVNGAKSAGPADVEEEMPEPTSSAA